ncbi:MAG: L,D-transpeptidase family protein [Clostridiales bacterium]|jgi:hypothetical protein|nr:L,D-transpeptidase family protein [Eubacteriales bacterium]MDH7566622.1 L,D-transpeptidase family protein [Clostridiales bacterium]
MVKKRWIILLCLMAVSLSFAYVVNNVLCSDDVHPKATKKFYEDIMANGDYLEAEEGEKGGSSVADTKSNKRGYTIHINLDTYTMFVYKDNELIKTYPVSGGKPTTPSPLGTWKIISKDTWGEGFGGAWMGFNVPWGMYGIHGTTEPWSIGRVNSSKGCIRMNNKDVKELYKIIPYGTTVTIAQNNRVFRTMKSGDVGSDVKEIQTALKSLGYYKGSIDGKYGEVLKSSVKKFQKDHKLYSNGVVNKQVYNLIREKLEAMEN